MGAPLHLKDWESLADKAGAFAISQNLARALAPVVDAFTKVTDEEKPGGDGIVFAAKDMFDDADHTPSLGLSAPPVAQNARPADVMNRLQGTGGRLLGYTKMTALAYEPSGINADQGAPRNPWHADFVPGGSSSGSAVAVASGAAFLAVGSDTAGSLRIPAHCSGITAWKPSNDDAPNEGAMALSPSLDAVGLMARSARDIAPYAKIIAPTLAGTTNPVKHLCVLDDAINKSAPAIARACQDATKTCVSLGIDITRRGGLDLLGVIGDCTLLVLQYEAARAHENLISQPGFDAVLAKRLNKGFEISDADYARALSARADLMARFEAEILGDTDALLLPVMPIETPRVSQTDPASPHFSGRVLYAMSAYTRFVNALGLPAIAFPVGFDQNAMPVAAQLVGRPGSDLALLAFVRAFQSATDHHGRLPTGLQESLHDHGADYGEFLA